MRRTLLHLLMVVCIVFAPVANVVSDVNSGRVESSMQMDDCVDCKHHQERSSGSCEGVDCLVKICLHSTAYSFHLLPGSAADMAHPDPDSPGRYGDYDARRYLSQTPTPLSRPPIA